MNELFEKLAAVQHDIWAHWQGYVHNQKLSKALSITREDFDHWQHQIETPYAELSEKEKDSDREQVEKFWPLIEDLDQISYLIGNIYFHGNFVAETPNEKALEILLRKHGYFFETEDQMIAAFKEHIK